MAQEFGSLVTFLMIGKITGNTFLVDRLLFLDSLFSSDFLHVRFTHISRLAGVSSPHRKWAKALTTAGLSTECGEAREGTEFLFPALVEILI